MESEKIISGNNIDEIWRQITPALNNNELSNSFIINQQNRKIFLNIEIDPGGGFEGGYQTTTLQYRLEKPSEFKFALHHQGLLDEIGKFFGMEDIETGYAEFDKKVIVKTNDPEKLKSVFSEKHTRAVFEELMNFTFHITQHHIDETETKADFLELNIDEAITDAERLYCIYHAFISVATGIEGT
ncbi:MAG: hypothetical protein M3Z56_02135 [Bacteroidota bacterium]|nr:hypothetical protein [Bacteroidota bacterium]